MILFLGFVQLSQAQEEPSQARQAVQAVSFDNDLRKLFANDGTLNRGTNMMMRTFDNRRKIYQGSPYVFPYWLPADIYLKDGTVLKHVPTKFNVYQKQALFILHNQVGDSLMADLSAISQFVLQDSSGNRHVFRRFAIGEKNSDKFCQVLHEGTYSLIAHHTRLFLPSDINKAQSTGRYYDKFISRVDFYIVNPERKLAKIKKSYKSLLKALPPNKEFEAYLKRDKPDFAKPTDLIAAIEFYNKLFGQQSGHKQSNWK